MKNEYYALYLGDDSADYELPGFCCIDPETGAEIGSLEEVMATKKQLESYFSCAKYKVVKLIVEVIE